MTEYAHASLTVMPCRPACAACCIAPSISSPIPGIPNGKPAGVACIQLDNDWRCKLFGDPRRPAVCRSLTPTREMCGDSRAQALRWLGYLETATTPTPSVIQIYPVASQNEMPPNCIEQSQAQTELPDKKHLPHAMPGKYRGN